MSQRLKTDGLGNGAGSDEVRFALAERSSGVDQSGRLTGMQRDHDERPAADPRVWPDAPTAEIDGRPDRATAVVNVFATLRRRKWWVIQALVIIPLAVGLLTSREHKEYTATASLLFQDQAANVLGSGGGSNPSFQVATDTSLAGLPAISTRAVAIAGGGVTEAEVAAAVSVTPGTNGDVTQISATATSPVEAAVIANAYGEAYVAFRDALDRSEIQAAIATLNQSLAALTPSDQAGALGTALRSQLGTLALANALVAGDAALVSRATPPAGPSRPRLVRNLILAIIIALIAGLALAFIRERFDQRVRSPEELERLFGMPLLARIPRLRRRRARRGAARGPDPRAEEAFRTLRANIRYFGRRTAVRSILISSPMREDGKSTIAHHLATTMAAMGDRVVLVDADMRDGSSPVSSAASSDAGLSTVLGGESLEAALYSFSVTAASNGHPGRELTMLAAGPRPANPSELLDSARMIALLAQLEENFDVVVIDSPALTRLSDARGLVARVSGVLVVGSVNHTQRHAAWEFREQIALLGGHVVGVVANRAAVTRGRDYEYEH